MPPAEIRMDESYARETVFLACIHAVENPTDSKEPGPAGELGPFQFIQGTWERYTQLPFTVFYVCDLGIADTIARRHYTELQVQLRKAGIAPTPYNLAVAWNGGLGGVYGPGKNWAAIYDYAQRVQNLVDTYDKGRK